VGIISYRLNTSLRYYGPFRGKHFFPPRQISPKTKKKRVPTSPTAPRPSHLTNPYRLGPGQRPRSLIEALLDEQRGFSDILDRFFGPGLGG